ncbi:MAG: glycosyltransferase family 1 protein [Bacteroidota bacterium]
MAKQIKIAVDIRDLRIAKTGAKTYLEEICREFKKTPPGFRFLFIDTVIPVYRGNNKFLKLIEHIRFFWWKQLQLPLICFFRGCDVLYCTDYFLPYLKLNFKTVVVFHDAFFWEYPLHYNKIWLFLFQQIAVRAALKADAIVTTTAYSKKQILQFADFQPDKMIPIYLAPKSIAPHLPAQSTALGFPGKYILHVGVMEKRKNLLNLIRAFDLLLKEGYEDYYLVLAGSRVFKSKLDDAENIHSLIAELGLHEKVRLPGFISDEELALYYTNASLYAFVSVNEGFGIPVLEAFQHQLPTLVANNSSLPEVGGNAVITCDPFDYHDIKEKMKHILSDHSLQKELISNGNKRLELFSWQKTAEHHLAVFKKVLAE